MNQFYVDAGKDCPPYAYKEEAIRWLKEAASNNKLAAVSLLQELGVEMSDYHKSIELQPQN